MLGGAGAAATKGFLLNRSPINLTDDIRLPFSLGEKRKLRAARGSGITATTINYHVTLVFRASRALRRPKLNPNPWSHHSNPNSNP